LDRLAQDAFEAGLYERNAIPKGARTSKRHPGRPPGCVCPNSHAVCGYAASACRRSTAFSAEMVR
jgi:hypothetical protein